MTTPWTKRSVLLLAAAGSFGHTLELRADDFWVFFGTYTGAKSQGIYASRFDAATGTLGEPILAATSPNPSFLAMHPSGKFLYAVNEVGEFRGQKGGSVTAFSVDSHTGSLTRLNEQPSHGAAPCHLVVDKTGRRVLVANYNGGNVASIPVESDGSLGVGNHVVVAHEGWSVNPQRQAGPHAHSINLDSANRFAVAADLGIDKLMVYRFDASSGALEPNDVPAVRLPAGSGPRHFAFRPNQRNAYVINEMLSTVAAFRYDAKSGEFTWIDSYKTLPEGSDAWNSTAHIEVHPSGKFVYGSNRGHDSIVVFSADRRGRLTWVENEPTQGKTPRNFGVDPTGRWLLAANQNSDSVVVFRVDAKTGALEPTGGKIEVGAPVCVKYLATHAH
ncbi:MAG: lactonase family protein [Limisphaerales bacterium]